MKVAAVSMSKITQDQPPTRSQVAEWAVNYEWEYHPLEKSDVLYGIKEGLKQGFFQVGPTSKRVRLTVKGKKHLLKRRIVKSVFIRIIFMHSFENLDSDDSSDDSEDEPIIVPIKVPQILT